MFIVYLLLSIRIISSPTTTIATIIPIVDGTRYKSAIDVAANYLASNMNPNESAVIVCAFNLLNQDMLWFYLPEDMKRNQIWQYPELAVDSFKPNFNITEFVSLCEQRNVKYAILYDYGAETPFFNTTLTYSNVTTLLYESGRFGYTGDEPFFGEMPYRTFLAGFHEPYSDGI